MAKVGYIGNTPDQTSVIVARQFVNIGTDGVGIVTFNSGYTPGYLDVFLNGVKLQDAVDFAAADGRTINFTTSASSGDVVELVAFKALTLGASNIGVTSAGTVIASEGIQTLNFVGSGNTFLLRGNTVDVSISGGGGGGSIGVSSNSFSSFVGSGITHINFIGAAVTTVGLSTAAITINKTFSILARDGLKSLNVTSGVSTIQTRTGVGTITF